MSIRIAVIGAGHLGRIHCRLLGELEDVQLVGAVEPLPAGRDSLVADLSVPAFADCREIIGRVDAAIIATPTVHHHSVATRLLDAGVHVFIEKPLATSSEEASELVTAAEAAGLVLQTGHSERFNPAFQFARSEIADPRLIEARRCGPYTFRSTDVGVVMDLMVHDIDLALQLVRGAKLASVEAVGGYVFGPREDWAEARLTFDSGCVANLSVSRVSPNAERTMRLHGTNAYAQLNFADGAAEVVRQRRELLELDASQMPPAEMLRLKERLFEDLLPLERRPATPWNAILEEQRDFVASIREGRRPQVTGADGRDAVRVAERVVASIERSRRQPLRKAG